MGRQREGRSNEYSNWWMNRVVCTILRVLTVVLAMPFLINFFFFGGTIIISNDSVSGV